MKLYFVCEKSLTESKGSNYFDSEGNELSLQQAEYFRNSKVRDRNGNLMVAFKRTKSGLNSFNPGMLGEFFSDTPLNDSYFGKHIGRFYLNIERPLVVDAQRNDWSYPLWLFLTDNSGNLVDRSELSDVVKNINIGIPKSVWEYIYDDDEEYEFDSLALLIKNHNLPYDGIILKNITEGVGSGKQVVTDYVVLRKEQIEYIDGGKE